MILLTPLFYLLTPSIWDCFFLPILSMCEITFKDKILKLNIFDYLLTPLGLQSLLFFLSQLFFSLTHLFLNHSVLIIKESNGWRNGGEKPSKKWNGEFLFIYLVGFCFVFLDWCSTFVWWFKIEQNKIVWHHIADQKI